MSDVKRNPAGMIWTLLFVVLAGPVLAERDFLPIRDYRTESWFLPQSPAVTAGPVAGLFNPAVWALTDEVGADFWWNDSSIRNGLDNYGFGFGRGLNFSMNTTTWGVPDDSWKVYDYQIGLAGGSRAGTAGIGYRWSHGETQRTPRQKTLAVGLASRVRYWTTFGASANFSLESNAAQYVFDLGIRPLGRNWLTIFADWAVNDDQAFFKRGNWGAGLEVRPIKGVHLGGKVRERPVTGDLDYSLMAGVTIGFTNIAAMPFYDDAKGEYGPTSWLIRSNPPLPGINNHKGIFDRGQVYHPINLENKVLTYQKYRFFDDKRVAWLDLLKVLNHLLEDDNVDGLVLNLSGFKARPSLAWELRRKLEEFQDRGKTVMVHGDRMDPITFYVATVADRLSLDPQGALALPGFQLSRSYLKGTLEKLGLGFQEFRYFEYKSALETFSRDSMSDADREQRKRIVDVLYETTRAGSIEGRGMTEEAFDDVVDNHALVTANEALELGLVDVLGRWDGLAKQLQGEGIRLSADANGEINRVYYDDQWGQPALIPVVYAVGPCAMDSGIKGRKTSAFMRKLAGDRRVKAVVLRADSPGGDALPSDLIAEAVLQLRQAGKPVIVSQGDVAASGGYWISMNGSEILTTPLTITGSIGVIGGWLWDDGFMAKAGITSDHVQRGAHADLFRTINMPFLGGIPARGLTEDELERAKVLITDMYADFVARVATGRSLDEDAVREVAQGHVWMGGDAIDHGLVDRFGTLDEAINLARERAGVPEWQSVQSSSIPRGP